MANMQTPAPPTSSSVSSGPWTGWVVFASIMLVVVGSMNLVQGFAALFNDDYFVIGSGDELLFADFGVWGVIMLIWGGAQVLAGMGLNSGQQWARVIALIIACVSILIQILFLAAFPLWCALIITLDVIVVYALTVRWAEARGGL
jgi:hypothetical protein